MALETCECGRTLPPPGPRGGRRRTKCEVCSPPRPKPAAGPPPTTTAQLLPFTAAGPAPEPTEGVLVPESVFSATLKQLAAAGRAHTAAGAAALALAKQLDQGVPTAPSVSNAMLKALDVALAGAKQAPDWLDELADRRERRASGA